jgi:predicted transcriptional regulator
MISPRQQELLDKLKEQPDIASHELCDRLGITRGRLNQLIVPLIKQGLVKRQGAARATVYQITDKRTNQQIRRQNWELNRRVRELEQQLDDRKVIERAKELLIAQFDIPATEAYRKLQEQSMESGRTMIEIAEGIIRAFEESLNL